MLECPICVENTKNLIAHFRHHHKMDLDQIINTLFAEIQKQKERVTNLCELLEIRER
jgi:hypothetical protein